MNNNESRNEIDNESKNRFLEPVRGDRLSNDPDHTETARIFYEGGSPSMALTTLENEVLIINPEHREGNELKEECLKTLGQ